MASVAGGYSDEIEIRLHTIQTLTPKSHRHTNARSEGWGGGGEERKGEEGGGEMSEQARDRERGHRETDRQTDTERALELYFTRFRFSQKSLNQLVLAKLLMNRYKIKASFVYI